MAKIEMDISEYEVMRENKKLLEQSLEKERSLQEEVKKLNAEKIKALEDAKMKVVKVKRTEVVEYALRKTHNNNHDFLFRLCSALKTSPQTPIGLINTNYIDYDSFEKLFFEKTRCTSLPIEEVTTCGLDDIKSEIRADLKSEMDEQTKYKLERAEEVLTKMNDLVKENKKLVNVNDSLSKTNENLFEQSTELTKKLNDLENIEKKYNQILEILEKDNSFFKKYKVLSNIKTILKD
jgi:hypothetical protein